jgi:hypothetical protein
LQQQLGERLLKFILDGIRVGGSQSPDAAGAPCIGCVDRWILEPRETVNDVFGGKFLAAAK